MPFLLRRVSELQIDDGRENSDGECQYQPFETMPSQESGEMQDEDGNRYHVK